MTKSKRSKTPASPQRKKKARTAKARVQAAPRDAARSARGEGGNGTLFAVEGKMSTFGGPLDFGVSPSEGLALFERPDLQNPLHRGLFLPTQPPGTTGLARRLNPDRFYIACRWNYSQTSREFLRNCVATVTNPQTGRSLEARPADWGPNVSTRRVADLSPGLAAELGLETDDDCVVRIERTDGPARRRADAARGPQGREGHGEDAGHGTSNPPPDIIRSRRSPYHSSRNNGDIDSIVLHFTDGATTEGTLSWFENNPRSVSSHYVIGRDGTIYQMVDDTERANHCKGANRNSIGIEHVALEGQPLSEEQEVSSIRLIKWLVAQYEIPFANIEGHQYARRYTGAGTDCPHSLYGARTEQAVRDWVDDNIA